jgi:predicted dehydrogenase
MAHWLLDDEPRRVYAVSRSGVLKEMGVDVADFHIAVVEFEQGAVVTLENAWILPETAPNVFDMKFEVLGSKGALQINTSDHRAMQLYTQEQALLPDVFGIAFDDSDSSRIGGFVLESIARFVDAVVSDTPVVASGEDGLLVTRVLTAIEESASSGRPVDL